MPVTKKTMPKKPTPDQKQPTLTLDYVTSIKIDQLDPIERILKERAVKATEKAEVAQIKAKSVQFQTDTMKLRAEGGACLSDRKNKIKIAQQKGKRLHELQTKAEELQREAATAVRKLTDFKKRFEYGVRIA